jgi:hypothetical protein
MRMLEPSDDVDFLQKPADADRVGERLMQHLDRDFPVVLEILGKKDGRHPALANRLPDRVAIPNRILQLPSAFGCGR